MPLNTQIVRDGKPLTMPNGWGGFHVAAMVMAAAADSGKGPYQDMKDYVKNAKRLMRENGAIGVNPSDTFRLMDYGVISMTPLNSADYVLKLPWTFHDNADGERLELLPGDVLKAWRD